MIRKPCHGGRALLLVLSACASLLAHAGEFLSAFEAALQNDAGFQSARAELASAQQNLPIAKAGLRPNLSLSFSDSKVEGTRTIDNPAPFPPTTTPLDYRAPARSLNLRAPLYNREASKKIDAAAAQEKAAQAVFALRQMDLLDRLAKAWLDARFAQQDLLLAQAQATALASQSELVQRRLALGEGTRLEVADAQAQLEQAKVAVSDAQLQLDLAQLTVRQTTGSTPGLAAPGSVQLAKPVSAAWVGAAKMPPLEPLADLQAKAEANSPSLLSRRYAIEVAGLNVERARAGHYPRLDLVASLSQSANESLSTVNQAATQQSLGLQLNIPLYGGGAVNAGVTQALADQQKAQADLLVEQQTLVRDLTRLYYAAVQAGLRVAAQEKAIAAAQLALQAAARGLAAGLASQAEIIQAQRRIAQSRQDWTQALQDQMLAQLRVQERVNAEAALVANLVDGWLAQISFDAP